MDPASAIGIATGVAGLAGQLLTASMQCYTIFSDAKDFSVDHDSFSWELETERERLMRWEAIWGVDSGGLKQKLDPGDRRYRYAVGTLARILALFADVGNLSAKYGIQERNTAKANADPPPCTSGSGVQAYSVRSGRRRDQFLAILPFPRSRSRIRENTAGKSTTELSRVAPVPALGASSVKTLENPSVLQNKDLVPGLREEIQKLNEAAVEMQELLPTYRKLQWAIVDKTRSSQLIEQLRKYNDGLFDVLPEPSRVDSMSAAPAVPFSKFDIPFRLPVQRNKIFSGREDLLEKIHNALKPSRIRERHVVVLYGLGGIGKSQLSIEYAYRHYSLYSSVFWIDATSQATLDRSVLQMAEQLVAHYETKWGGSKPDFVQIGTMLGLHGCIGSTGQLFEKAKGADADLVMKAMRKWLSSTGNDNWLVIFENNDDIESIKLQDFVPAGECGNIIITTRRPEISCLGVGIEVGQVDVDAGVSILLASAGKNRIGVDQGDLKEAETIAKKLGYLPLALNQAGGYITTMQIPLPKYLPLYTTNFKRVASTKHPSLENYRNDTFLTTWQISFDALPLLASELLLLCAFLGNQSIIEELVQRGKDNIPWLGKDDDLVHDALKPLLSFSLAKRDSNPDRFVFHPLVLEWARESLDQVRRKGKAKEALMVVGKSLDYKQSEKSIADWVFESQIMAHVDLSLKNFREYFSTEPTHCALSEDVMDAVENIGNLCISHYRLKDAEETIGRILVDLQKVSVGEKETARVLRCVHSMGLVFMCQQKYQKALEMFEKARIGRVAIFGEEHPDTLDSLDNLGSALQGQEKYGEALGLYEKLLPIVERVFGKDHIKLFSIFNDMAIVLEAQRRYEEALPLYERALAGWEKTLGKEHPDTLTTVHNMASLLQEQRRYEEALPLYERALAGQEETLGKEHPDTLTTVHNMASLLQDQKQYEEALVLYERALAGQEETLGKEHPDTLATVHNMALLLQGQRRYEEALPLYERALAGWEKTPRKEYPDTLTTVHNMALLLQDQRRYEEALALYGRALAGQEETLGKGHPDTLATVHNMASLLQAQGRYEEALVLYERALAGREETLGKEHPNTLTTVHNMASILQEQGRYGEARDLFQRVFDGREKELGAYHPGTVRASRQLSYIRSQLSSEGKDSKRTISRRRFQTRTID